MNFDTVFYPADKSYTTIEVIKKNQAERLNYISPAHDSAADKPRNDLIDQRVHFDWIEGDLMFKGELGQYPNPRNCPVYHCISGFGHPKLKPYLAIFDRGAVKERKLIIDTLNHDKSPSRRSAAVFLMGHFTDPNDIITQLLPHVNDPDAGVRNNVMRVIAMTIKNG